ncbi:glycosyltransferase family 39 protein [Sphingomonas sp. LB-2]|uniref:phospholipid carrier-dependent glycosyltransferase n=1 Tax=Sphingomonas caeni TaxID=2984949 RepID=UPI002232A572|nr:phospholipid carrier-dependent glycosyltransferase [Sphingomonas caeni]MCW3848698.1 glycosyltransferase family 39 protein [Sphingomonas caeni]
MLARLKAFADSLAQSPLRVALLIGLAAELLFVFHLGQPTQPFFDETHYLPAARGLLALDMPRNTEHPLLGKELLAAGIALFGDNPMGWRLIPTLFGAATIMGVFAFLWLLLRNTRLAVLGAVLALFNQMVFIQARIAMLDVFLGAFIVWALVMFLWAAEGTPKQVRRRWIAGSALLGLAVAVKWAAIPYEAMAGLAFILLRLRDAWRAKKPFATAFGAKDQPHWAGLGTFQGLLLMGAVSIPIYFVTFAPAFFYDQNPLTLATLIPFQIDMYAQQTQVLAAHTYQSSWYQWPLISRPIWYFYEEDMGTWRGVLLVGNPLIMWGGVLAVLLCLIAWIETRALRPAAMALLWIASVAIYIIIPKSLGFYYYYYLSSIFLCFVLPIALDLLDPQRKFGLGEWFAAAAFLVFFYFYAILSAEPLEGPMSFQYWMWFDSWR